MDWTDWCVLGSNSSPGAAICFYSATNRVIGLKYYSGTATDFGFAQNGWRGVASAGRKRRLKATESGSRMRNSRCFWEELIWRKPEPKIGIDTKKKTSKKLVINTVFLLVSN
jgi:hypothetical protein